MSQSAPDYVMLTSVASVVVAVGALLFAVLSFRSSMKLQKKIAEANVKPDLQVKGKSSVGNYMELIMKNTGFGTAEITQMSYRRGNKTDICIAPLLSDSIMKALDNMPATYPPPFSLRAGDTIALFRFKKSPLHEGISPAQLDEVYSLLQKELREITLDITYNDVFGNRIESKSIELRDALKLG